jgi:hypothetical protein
LRAGISWNTNVLDGTTIREIDFLTNYRRFRLPTG